MMKTGELNELLGPMSECLSPDELALVGLKKDNSVSESLRDGAEKAIVEYEMASQQHTPQVRMQDRRDFHPWEGKASDGEIMFNFEDEDDARDVYEYFTGEGLLTPGEIRLHVSENQSSVHFAPHVLVAKPEVIQAVMIHFAEHLDDDQDEQWESLAEEITDVIMEKKKATGKPNVPNVGFNPYHKASDGTFSGQKALKAKKQGSWSDGSRRLAAGVKGKNLHFKATKLPCGRGAREAGKNTRCWDGNPGVSRAAFALSRGLKGKKKGGPRKMESVSARDKMIVESLKRSYR